MVSHRFNKIVGNLNDSQRLIFTACQLGVSTNASVRAAYIDHCCRIQNTFRDMPGKTFSLIYCISFAVTFMANWLITGWMKAFLANTIYHVCKMPSESNSYEIVFFYVLSSTLSALWLANKLQKYQGLRAESWQIGKVLSKWTHSLS